MSAVDVLAVMDGVVIDYETLLPECAATVREARAAVAEAFAERDELIARRQQDMAILDAIRDAVGGGPYDTIATRVAELVERERVMREALSEIIAINDESEGVFRKRGGTRRGLSIVAARAALARVQGGQS